jgi:outer membrane receptor protein involved in Fe transport
MRRRDDAIQRAIRETLKGPEEQGEERMKYQVELGSFGRQILIAGASVMALTFAMASSAAAAQDEDSAQEASVPASQPAESASSSSGDAILVTGSRIRQPGLESATPVTSLGAEALNILAPGSVANALDSVPAFFNNSNATSDSSSNVPSARGSNVNLRGLDPNRTLVLLNGRRVVPGSKVGTVNIDLIPQQAIERVDIVTGGASAAYGTDAVAGVVNFVLDTDYNGIKGSVQGGISTYGDNENGQAALTFGVPLGERAHLLVSGQLFVEEGIEDESDRAWYDRDWGTIINPAFTANGTLPRRITVPNLVPVQWTCGGLIAQPGSALNNLDFQSDGSVLPFVFTDLRDANNQSLVGGGGSGCDPQSPGSDDGPMLTNDVRRMNLFSYLDYDVSDNVNVFVQALYARNRTGQQGQSATFRRPWQLTIYRENPFLPQEITDIMDAEGRSSFTFQKEAGPDLLQNAQLDIINKTTEITAGFDATLETGGVFDGWNINGYAQWGKNRQENRFYGSADYQHIIAALDAVRDPNTGDIVCHASLSNSDYSDCVPINFFGQGNVSEAARHYATTPLAKDEAIYHQFDLTEKVAEIVASGEIFKGWAGPITMAVGASYRKQKIVSDCVRGCNEGISNSVPGLRGVPSGFANDPDIQVFGSYADVDGSFDVKEVFAEANIPLLRDSALGDQITFAPAVRYADYEGSGGIWSYKFGLDWDLNGDLRLRGTYSRDVRAATLGERFDRQRASGNVQDDPVTGDTYIFSSTVGGNPNLAPEKADTYTVGAVYQPSWFSGFNVTLDYYKIDISGAVGQLGAQAIIDRCFEGATSLCGLITRDPVSQYVINVENVFININKEKASGIDAEVNYRTPLNVLGGGEEDLTLRVLGTLLLERATVIDGVKTDMVGQIPSGSDIRQPAYPKIVANAMVNYSNGPWSLLLQERYYHHGKRDLDDVEGVDIDDNSVKARLYTDLRLSYETGAWQFFGQVINLLNSNPPLLPNTSFYDPKGRRFIVGASFEF